MNNHKTHLRINHPVGGPEPTFFVTACGRRHLHSGQILGGPDNSHMESAQEPRFAELAPYHARICKTCRHAWAYGAAR